MTENYYPVTTAVSIKDEVSQLLVVTDRPQGATSLSEGVIELMQHRRIPTTDGKGMGEALDEVESVKNTYYVYLSHIN